MEILGAEETAARLPYPALADAIREVALAAGIDNSTAGGARAPTRTALPLPGGAVLLVMPASDGEIAMTKLVTVHPGNPGRGLPTIRGELVAMEALTGERLGVLDGATVTARRTAALSLLAAREFARRPEGPLLVVGAGAQGRAHLEAFREGLGVREVFVASRTPDRAERLADHARRLGMRARAVGEPGEVLGEAGLVVTATTSREPVLPEDAAGKLPEGAFVSAVGSFSPGAAELPPGLIASSAVVVDTLEGAREEAGDLLRAETSGAFRWEDAMPLGAALRTANTAASTVVFKSVGHALWDLAAARTAFPPENPGRGPENRA